MDGKKPLQSQSRASRVVCETFNSEKLVWLAPVSSPLLSPGREKMQVARKKVKQGSIFAFPRRAKVSIEAEEPTSPKVSCIGQVRASKETSFSDNRPGKNLHYKSSSASPASFFPSPGGQSKWRSLFRLRKDGHCATSSSPGYCGGEVSCFGTPRNSPSDYNSERSCSAFFAKSLLLLQQCEERAECSKSEAVQMRPHAQTRHSPTPAHAHNDAVDKSIVPNPSSQFACEQGDRHTLPAEGTSSEPMIIQQKQFCGHETLKDECVHESLSPTLNRPTNLCEAVKHLPAALPSIEHLQERMSVVCETEKNIVPALPFEENRQGFMQDPPCEELHCLCCNKHNTTPETWSCRSGEESRHDGVSLVNGACDEIFMGISRDHLREAQGEEGLASSSCDEDCLSYDAKDCHRHEAVSCQSQFTATHSSTSNGTTLEGDITCRGFKSEDSSCTDMCPLKEEENANVEILDRADEHGSQGQDLHDREEHPRELKPSHAMDHVLSTSSYICDTHNWENYRMPFLQLCEKDLHCFLGKVTPRVHEASSGDAFLLLENNLSRSFAWFKDNRDKFVTTCEVGKMSFHGARRQLHWLEGGTKFIRSRSATSYRTVIRLQRCKSDSGRLH